LKINTNDPFSKKKINTNDPFPLDSDLDLSKVPFSTNKINTIDPFQQDFDTDVEDSWNRTKGPANSESEKKRFGCKEFHYKQICAFSSSGNFGEIIGLDVSFLTCHDLCEEKNARGCCQFFTQRLTSRQFTYCSFYPDVLPKTSSPMDAVFDANDGIESKSAMACYPKPPGPKIIGSELARGKPRIYNPLVRPIGGVKTSQELPRQFDPLQRPNFEKEVNFRTPYDRLPKKKYLKFDDHFQRCGILSDGKNINCHNKLNCFGEKYIPQEYRKQIHALGFCLSDLELQIVQKTGPSDIKIKNNKKPLQKCGIHAKLKLIKEHHILRLSSTFVQRNCLKNEECINDKCQAIVCHGFKSNKVCTQPMLEEHVHHLGVYPNKIAPLKIVLGRCEKKCQELNMEGCCQIFQQKIKKQKKKMKNSNSNVTTTICNNNSNLMNKKKKKKF
jgi:hypothetical protein